MARRIRKTENLESIPFGRVFFVQQCTMGYQSDSYEVGIMMPDTFPKTIQESIKQTFDDAYRGTYNSRIMDSIWSKGRNQIGKDWNTGSMLNDSRTHKGRLMIVALVPGPECYGTAERFANGMERRLK